MKCLFTLFVTFIISSAIGQTILSYDTLEAQRLTDSVGFNLNAGNYLKTLDFADQALELYNAANHPGTVVRRFKAHTWKRVDNFEEALKLYRVNYNISQRDTSFLLEEIVSLLNMGRCFLELGSLDSAIYFEQEAIKKMEEHGDTGLIITARSILAEAYALKGELENALEEINTMKYQLVSESLTKNDLSGFALINIGQVYNILGEYDSAIVYTSYVFLNEESVVQKIDASKELYNSYLNLNESDSAFKYLRIKYELEEQGGLDEMFSEMLEIANTNRLEKDSLQNQLELNSIKAENEAKLEVEATRRTYLLIGMSIAVIFALIALYSYIKKRKSNRIIAEQKVEVDRKNEEIMDSIAYAKRIQTAILPPPKLVKEFLNDSFILYKPKDIVAGDFYWLEPQEGRVLFAAADCTGHGVPGAMVSVVCNNSLNRSVREFGLVEPGKILGKTRELVIQEFEKSEEEVKDGMDIALCSLEGHQLKYAGAHNPLWIIRKGTSEIEEIKADKQPIGKFAVSKPFTTHSIELNAGDTFYTFSDGFADQFGGEKGKKFKAKNFKALLLSIQHENMERQNELIDEAFENWRGNLEQLDDVCVIGVRV